MTTMEEDRLQVVRGSTAKPVASDSLVDALVATGCEGQLMIGYPIIATPEGRHNFDAVFVSPTYGVVVFDLVEGQDLDGSEARQDDAVARLTSRLLTHRGLTKRRRLAVPIASITFAPGINDRNTREDPAGYTVSNASTLPGALAAVEAALSWDGDVGTLFGLAVSAIQSMGSIRRARTPRQPSRQESRGAKLLRLEDAIATLDNMQNKAVVETVDGVQRIRGLAGSGKTIVLALKAAYLHATHPDWRMAVTFNTRSLKGHFNRLINTFCIEQTGDEPNWDNLRVINAWGAPGGGGRSGIYHEFCSAFDVEYLDFSTAKSRYGRDEAFGLACELALESVPEPSALYDAILVDEAQDFPPSFLRLCYEILDDEKRLVYAYDELQNLAGTGVQPPEVIFGADSNGDPRVTFPAEPDPNSARRDIILEKCYRNSRPVLVTAHALGFGTQHKPLKGQTSGLVQMFDQPSLWTEIGYEVVGGQLAPGHDVRLARTSESSPVFLEDHSSVDDLVAFHIFDTEAEQAEWVAEQIQRNLEEDELRHDDIVVINTNPITTRRKLGIVRKALIERGIVSHLAGVDTSADVFFAPDRASITCTGVFRAKGNEAGMVYVINGQECESEGANLAQLRNRLFTAITRSKAWVRVCGVGSSMEDLREEFDSVKSNGFQLQFNYPTDEEREKMQIVHRDMSKAEAERVAERRSNLGDLIADLEEGRLYPEDLDDEMLSKLRGLLDK